MNGEPTESSNSLLKKGSDPLRALTFQGNNNALQRVRPLFQQAVWLELRYDLTIVDAGEPLVCSIGPTKIRGAGNIVRRGVIDVVADEPHGPISHQEMSSAIMRTMEGTFRIGRGQKGGIEFLACVAGMAMKAIVCRTVVVTRGTTRGRHVTVNKLTVGPVGPYSSSLGVSGIQRTSPTAKTLVVPSVISRIRTEEFT